MSIEEDTFKRFYPDFEKLEQYGFKKTNSGILSCERFFMDNAFKAKISVQKSGVVKGIVYDVENNDEYLPLRVENNQGAYTAEVKSAYINLLEDIRDNCFCEQFFISPQANRICNLIIKKYGNKPEFLWKTSPDCGVFRNKKTEKWYGIVMYISRLKLLKKAQGFVEVINLKLDKDEIQELLQRDGYYPAYHMNKKLWITISLDETLKDSEIINQIDKSYAFSDNKKRPKA